MVNVGDMLENGGRVHAVLHTSSAGSLVMALYGDEWVTWRVNEGNRTEPDQCWGGHYFRDPENAQKNFLERAEHLMSLAEFYHINLGFNHGLAS